MDQNMTTTINKKLSTESHWNSIYVDKKRKLVLNDKESPFKEMVEYYDPLIKSLIAKKDKISILEIGCGASTWLSYFKQKYPCNVSGVDYVESGITLIKENFKTLNLEGDFYLCDFFNMPEKLKGKFDFVFSVGFIEHFDDTVGVLKIMKSLLNSDGIVINHIPNLKGLYGLYSKKYQRELYDMHKLFTLDSLNQNFNDAGLPNHDVSYTSGYWPHVINWSVLDSKYTNSKVHKLAKNGLILLYKVLYKLGVVSKLKTQSLSAHIIMYGRA
jgi:SAM-dependent methyltransferase